jgi:hypothetical protein
MAVLVAAVAASSVFLITHVVFGPPPSEEVQVLTSFALALAFILWVMADARSRHRTPCYDFGFLVGIFFPASLVWYVLWTRGWRGLLTLAALVGLMLLPYISATVARIILYGGP